MKIIFPEITNNSIAQEAIKDFPNVEFLPADNLEQAAKALANNEADALISGIDYPTRDVILACKTYTSLKSQYFSSSFICQKGNQILALADGGVNKIPNQDQLYCIVEDTAKTYQAFTGEQPIIAMLSYSTNGSGGKNNPDLEKIHFVINKIRETHPEWLIDGEMQLDTAIDPEVSRKKYPDSKVEGKANVLITPDLNSGNILYKSLERFGGYTCAGPIIQGFQIPLADLSRGSTVEDVKLTLSVIIKQLERN